MSDPSNPLTAPTLAEEVAELRESGTWSIGNQRFTGSYAGDRAAKGFLAKYDKLSLQRIPKTERALELESQGWEPWLRTLSPRTFTYSFVKQIADFWEWYWPLLHAQHEGKRLITISEELAYTLFLGRGMTKSVTCEWSVLAAGAIVGPAVVPYVSSTTASATRHLQSITTHAEKALMAEYYPGLAKPRVGNFNNRFGWNQKMLAADCGLTAFAIGLEGDIRGLRVEDLRPTLIICHKKGTEICDDDQWMKVEEHPTANISRFTNGYEIRLWGNPYPETVTPEHRYWCREYIPRQEARVCFEEGQTTWREAADLHSHCFLGLPIDTVVSDPQPIQYFHYTKRARNRKGQVAGCSLGSVFKETVPPEFWDPDWWWLFGLWWGDGHTTKTQVGLTIANKDIAIRSRVENLLLRWGKPFSVVPKEGCCQIVFAATHFARWLKTWRVGNSRKQPPRWVEQLPLPLQRQLVRGYIDADGWVHHAKQEVRVTSIHLPGLYSLRRILARLGIAASIRRGVGPGLAIFRGRTYSSQQKYDLRFREGADQFGWDIRVGSRYRYRRAFIGDGFLWSKVRDIKPVELEEFIPIKTHSGTYLTHFGLSHNCDDFDNLNDSPDQVKKKEAILGGSIFGTQTPDTIIIVAQNLIHRFSIARRIHTGRSPLLTDRRTTGIVKAFSDDFKVEQQPNGKYRITAGSPNWEGFDMLAAQKLVGTMGPILAKAEFQHEFDAEEGDYVMKNYVDAIHVITEEEFCRAFGLQWYPGFRMPFDWWKFFAHDKARTKTEFHANVALTLTVSSEHTRLPGITFMYDPISFEEATEPDDCAIRFLRSISPLVRVDGIERDWNELRQTLVSRANVEQFIRSQTERLKAERSALAKVFPQHVKPLLDVFNYKVFRMSHEADDWARIYHDSFGLPFDRPAITDNAGQALIDFTMKIDYSVADPFGRFGYWSDDKKRFHRDPMHKNPESKPLMGMSRWYLVVPTEKLPYPNDDRPDRLHGPDLARYQFTEQRNLAPKENALGEEERGPEKRNDDYRQALQMLYIDQIVRGRPLTKDEQVDLTLPAPIQNAAIAAETDPEKKTQKHYAHELAMRQRESNKIAQRLQNAKPGRNTLSEYKKLVKRGG